VTCQTTNCGHVHNRVSWTTAFPRWPGPDVWWTCRSRASDGGLLWRMRRGIAMPSGLLCRQACPRRCWNQCPMRSVILSRDLRALMRRSPLRRWRPAWGLWSLRSPGHLGSWNHGAAYCTANSRRGLVNVNGATPVCCGNCDADRWPGCVARWRRWNRPRSRGSPHRGRASMLTGKDRTRFLM